MSSKAVTQRGNQAPTGSNAARLDEFRNALLGRADDLTRALAGTIPAESFIEIALTAIATIKEPNTKAKVLNCTTESLVVAVIQAAHAGLRIDGRQSALVPYGNVATWTPMVKGRIDLIQRAPNVAKVVTRAVVEGDEFEYAYGTEEFIRHKPQLSPPAGAKLTHAYAIVFWRDGTAPTFEVLNRERIDQIRNQFSKASDGPGWSKSFNEMGRKCALNRVEQFVTVDEVTERQLRAAVESEFELPVFDPAEQASERVNAQVAGLRERVEGLKDQPETAEQRTQRLNDLEEARVELRRVIVGQIGTEVERQQLTREQATTEAKAALQLAGIADYPTREDGSPDTAMLSPEALRAVLTHLRALGPGFDGGGSGGSQGAPVGEGGQGPGGEPGSAQGAPEAQGGGGSGEKAPAPQATTRTAPVAQPGEPPLGAGDAPRDARGEGGAGVPPEPREGVGTKGAQLQCRRIDGGPVHLIDPWATARPPVCIGCNAVVGGMQGAKSATPSADPTTYCRKALEAVDQEYSAERVPDAVLSAVLAAFAEPEDQS